jgi:outer membrane lipoprotein-sorting protein
MRVVPIGLFLFWLYASAGQVSSAQPVPPTNYTVIRRETNGADTLVRRYYRRGNKAINELSGTTQGHAFHNRALYDLETHQILSWTLEDSSISTECVKLGFDIREDSPFDNAYELAEVNAKPVGTETLGGFVATILEYPLSGGKGRVWIDTKSNLLLRVQEIATNGAPRTTLEVTDVSYHRPPASLFIPPAKCATAANSPRALSPNERIAEETGSDPRDFQRTLGRLSTRDPGLSGPCTVLFRVVHAGSMEPITSGIQVKLDPTATLRHIPDYSGGHGGGLHEISSSGNGIFSIENAPTEFLLYLTFENEVFPATGIVPRRCFAPQTVLLYVVTNPAQKYDNPDWLWVKSGKYARP